MAFCTGCGSKLPDGVRFCPDCGQAIAGPPATFTPPPAPPAGTTGAGQDAAGQPPSGATPLAPGRPSEPSSWQPPAAEEEPQEEGLGGLAGRWLKTQFSLKSAREARVEERAIEREMRERVDQRIGETAMDALLPGWKDKMAEMEAHRAQQEAERAQRRRAEHEARPRADVQLVFSGAVDAALEAAIPVTVDRPEEPGQGLRISLEPVDPQLFSGHVFHQMQLTVPKYAGQGTYDLAVYEPRDDWDPEGFALTLDTPDEMLYWTTDYGPGVITVDADERTIRIHIAWQDSGGRAVQTDGVITLP